MKRLPLSLILVAGAIAMSPSVVVGEIEGGRQIEIRLEDVLILVLGLVWICGFLARGRSTVRKPPLLVPIMIWLGVGLLSVLTNLIVGNIYPIRGFFYFLKEIEFFFLYFYLFYHIRSRRSAEVLVYVWFFLGALNVLWVLAKLFLGFADEAAFWGAYGPGAIGEGAPFPSGGFFLLVSVFLINMSIYYVLPSKNPRWTKGILLAISCGLGLGVFVSGSRASVAGLFFSLPLMLLLYLLKTKRPRSVVLLGVLLMVVFAGELALALQRAPDASRVLGVREALGEFTSVETGITRIGVWERQLSEAIRRSPYFLILGYGKSAILATEESHSQYVRNLVETGTLGSVAFLVLVGTILAVTFRVFAIERDPLRVGLAGGAFVSTLVMLAISISGEAFVVVRISEAYWFFIGLTMGTVYGAKEVMGALGPRQAGGAGSSRLAPV